jgi:hypothetical protein
VIATAVRRRATRSFVYARVDVQNRTVSDVATPNGVILLSISGNRALFMKADADGLPQLFLYEYLGDTGKR